MVGKNINRSNLKVKARDKRMHSETTGAGWWENTKLQKNRIWMEVLERKENAIASGIKVYVQKALTIQFEQE